MSSTRRQFLQSTAAASLSPLPSTGAAPPALDGFQMARSHRIVREGPTPEFFEGMLLGNGDIGLCITVRPDALGLHIGKSDSWDIRVSEEQDAHVLSFEDFLKLWHRASAKQSARASRICSTWNVTSPFFREYTAKVTASYSKTWPRPWPCGSVWFHWDASRTQVVRQILDPSCGHYRLDLLQNGRPIRLEAFVNTTTGGLCLWSSSAIAISSVAYYPNLDASARLPAPEIDGRIEADRACLSAYQLFPSTAPTIESPHPASVSQGPQLRSLRHSSGSAGRLKASRRRSSSSKQFPRLPIRTHITTNVREFPPERHGAATAPRSHSIYAA